MPSEACYLHPNGHDAGETLWLVESKGMGFEVAAHCQLEAYDRCFADKDEAWLIENMGLIILARPFEEGEESDIAIHSAGLLLRYGLDDLAEAADATGERLIGARILGQYRARGGAWLLR